MSIKRTLVTAAALLITPSLLGAGVRGEAERYVCSLTKAVECDSELCGPPAEPDSPMPTFIRVDLDNNVITALAPDERSGETTPIRAIERSGDDVVMTGINAGRGWSITLSETDGGVVITVNLGDAAYVVFGQCIAEDLLSP